MSSGKVVEIIGAVVDVEFPRDAMPRVFDALTVDNTDIMLEVQQQLGDGVVRTIALGSTDGLKRGLPVTNTGAPISVPVGEKTLGRVMDVMGRPIDEAGPIGEEKRMPIHRKAPTYEEQAGGNEILETGVKVIDLAADFRLKDPAVWEEWYGMPHACPELLAEAVYGLPELYRDRIPGARLVASPGCYPTSAALALAPLVAEGLADPDLLVLDCASFIAGPAAATMLSDFGARVIKIEPPGQGDGYRLPPEKFDQWKSVEMTFNPESMRIR